SIPPLYIFRTAPVSGPLVLALSGQALLPLSSLNPYGTFPFWRRQFIQKYTMPVCTRYCILTRRWRSQDAAIHGDNYSDIFLHQNLFFIKVNRKEIFSKIYAG
ncbi:hypothetical protein, partial [Escherichia coli]|uniref:hypothetical protein n=1 Tax=Escherichia coli TaxID=562 RepID=UPI00289BB291